MDNIIESKIDADILNDVKKFLLMYFKIAGVALVVLFFVIFVKSFIMSVMLEGILLYAIWITALWLIYKYFRKNKSKGGIFFFFFFFFFFLFFFFFFFFFLNNFFFFFFSKNPEKDRQHDHEYHRLQFPF